MPTQSKKSKMRDQSSSLRMYELQCVMKEDNAIAVHCF